ncbi:hypothetical protein GE061_003581 [Apolygus lucorum]|uniref:oleoyl-[acyl-carrier-protein] hydrolase n=1 Tax=Apolygus lucorum TaxID=248454 RepID=A0A8S9X3W1_APOLU|nr:hypothetical protein GE061_003581 [Apolygus lucorum]
MGIKDAKTAGNSTLLELGMDSLMGTEIKQTLEINFDVVMSPQDIRSLTFAKLQELGNSSQNSGTTVKSETTKKDPPLQDKATSDSSDSPADVSETRVVPASSIRKLKTKSTNESTPVFLVHPVQGTVELLEEIASKVTRPVWGLECSEGAPMNSAQDLASHYVQMVRDKQAKGPYTMLAYSLGSVFGLEMAIKLEAEGEKVSLTLLDGSPDFVKGHIGIYYRNQINTANLDAFRWPYVTMLFTNKDYNLLSRELRELPTPADRSRRCSELLGCSEKTFLKAVELFWRKLEICKDYKPSGKLKSRLRLLKASENFVSNVGPDYDLSQYCESSVEVITIPGTTHQTIITGKAADRVAQLLNAS